MRLAPPMPLMGNARARGFRSRLQEPEIGDSASFPEPREIETRWDMIGKWRAAVVKQLLTPAPDDAAVTWKRAQLAGRGFSYLPTKAARIERVDRRRRCIPRRASNAPTGNTMKRRRRSMRKRNRPRLVSHARRPRR